MPSGLREKKAQLMPLWRAVVGRQTHKSLQHHVVRAIMEVLGYAIAEDGSRTTLQKKQHLSWLLRAE